MSTDYVPVACAFHDRLEHLALRRTSCRVHYMDGPDSRVAAGIVRDILTADGAEYLILGAASTRIRLDAITAIEEA